MNDNLTVFERKKRTEKKLNDSFFCYSKQLREGIGINQIKLPPKNCFKLKMLQKADEI